MPNLKKLFLLAIATTMGSLVILSILDPIGRRAWRLFFFNTEFLVSMIFLSIVSIAVTVIMLWWDRKHPRQPLRKCPTCSQELRPDHPLLNRPEI